MLTQIIYWSLFVIVWSSFVNGDSIRGLKEVREFKPIPCNPGTNGSSCVCPDVIKSDFTGCLKYEESIDGCHPINCWKWNEVKNQCEEDGKPFLPAMILQGIPLTGVFGSGFGNIGRWDLFGMYMGILFGGCCLILMGSACCLCCCKEKETDDEYSLMNDKESFIKCFGNCGACIWAIVILVFYILGIVWTATEGGVLDANGCPLIF